MKASSNGHSPVAEALIQAKADVNTYNVSSCSMAVLVTHTSVCPKRILEAAWFSLTGSLCVTELDEFCNERINASTWCVSHICAALSRHRIIRHSLFAKTKLSILNHINCSFSYFLKRCSYIIA